MPASLSLMAQECLSNMGSHSLLHLGALSIRLSDLYRQMLKLDIVYTGYLSSRARLV